MKRKIDKLNNVQRIFRTRDYSNLIRVLFIVLVFEVLKS